MPKILDKFYKLHKFEDPNIDFQISDVDDTATPNFYGFTAVEGCWMIIKEVINDGSPNTYGYVFGKSDYDFSVREGLTYVRVDQTLGV